MKKNIKRLLAGVISASMILSAVPVFAETEVQNVYNTKEVSEQINENTETATKDAGFVDYSVFDESVELNATPVEGTRYYFSGSTGSYFYYSGDTLYIDATKADSALYNKNNMSSITRNYWSTLESNSEITEVCISNVKNMPKGMFTNFKYIEKVGIYCDISSIGESAFANCHNLREVYIQSALAINTRAFYNCGMLETINLPEGLTYIYSSAFTLTKSLKEIILPNSLKRIGIYAFEKSGIESVNIPSSVVDIGTGAFENTMLVTVTIPETVECVYTGAFAYCENLQTAYISKKTKFSTTDGGLDSDSTHAWSPWNPFKGSPVDIYIDGYKEDGKSYGDDESKVHYSQELRVDDIPDQYYYGESVEPDVTVKLVNTTDGSSVTLTKDTDYRVTYENNNGVGEATVRIIFIGNYGKASNVLCNFNILNPDLEIEPIPEQLYVGNAVCPKVIIKDNTIGTTLSENIDYTVSYSNNTGVGTGIANISYINKYAGYTGEATSVSFVIREWDIGMVPDGSISVEDVNWYAEDVQYMPDGTVSGPYVYGEYSVEIDNKTYTYELIQDTDFYANYPYSPYGFTWSVGEQYVYIDGNGKFSGSTSVNMNVLPYNISYLQYQFMNVNNINTTGINYTFTGNEIQPFYNSYQASYGYSFIKYTNPWSISFEATGQDGEYVNGSHGSTVYKRNENKITLTYLNNINAGTGITQISGQNSLTGTLNIPFTITPADMSTVTEELISTEDDLVYIGNPVEAKYKLTLPSGYELVEGTDYTVSYIDNGEPGTATAVIVGKGNFVGELRKEFEVGEMKLPVDNVIDLEFTSLEISDEYTYNGEEKQPKPVVNYTYVVPSTGYKKDFVLEEGEDYTLRYENNVNAGTASVILEPIEGKSKNRNPEYFAINTADISSVTTQNISDQFYNSEGVEPELSLSFNGMNLVKDTDYEVVFENNDTVGTATAKIVGIGNYSGEISKDFNIIAALFSADTINIADIPDEEFNKLPHTPEPEVRMGNRVLVKDVDFEYSYGNNVNAGTANITVTGKGNYEGSVDSTFTIKRRNGSLFVYYLLFFEEEDDE